MQLNALSNYLQHQPLTNAATAEAASTDAADSASVAENGGYSPSQRAILISAVAAEFDVEHLAQEEVGQLQLKLQQFGLLQGQQISGFSLLHNARGQLQEGEDLNALRLLEHSRQRFDSDQVGYQQRQQINQMHTLVENLASARALNPPSQVLSRESA